MAYESKSIVFRVFSLGRNALQKRQKLMLNLGQARISSPQVAQIEHYEVLVTPLISKNVLYIAKLASGKYRGYKLDSEFEPIETELQNYEDASAWLSEFEMDIGIESIAWLSCVQWLFAVCDELITENEAINCIKAVQQVNNPQKLNVIKPINDRLGIATCTSHPNGDVLTVELDTSVYSLGYIQFSTDQIEKWDGPQISRSPQDIEKLVHRANSKCSAGRQAFVQLVNLYASNPKDYSFSLNNVNPSCMLLHYADTVRSTNSKQANDLFKGTRFISPFIAQSKYLLSDFDMVCKAVMAKCKSGGRTTECLDHLEWLFLHPKYPDSVPRRLLTLTSVILGYKQSLDRIFEMIARMSSHPVFRQGSLKKAFVNVCERAASIVRVWGSLTCTRALTKAISQISPMAITPLLVQFLALVVASPPQVNQKYTYSPLFADHQDQNGNQNGNQNNNENLIQYIIIESRVVLHSILPYVHNTPLDTKKLFLDASLGILKLEVAKQDATLNSMFYSCAFVLLTLGIDRQLIAHASQVYIQLLLDKRVNRAVSNYRYKIYDITLPPDVMDSVAKLINLQNLRHWPQLATIGCSRSIPSLKISCLPSTKERDQLILDGVHSAYLKAAHGSIVNVFDFVQQCQPFRRGHVQTAVEFMHTFYRHPRTKQTGISLCLLLKSIYTHKFSSARLTAELATYKCGLPLPPQNVPKIWYLVQFNGDFGALSKHIIVYSGHIDETFSDTSRMLSKQFHAPCVLYPEQSEKQTYLTVMRLYYLDDRLVHLHYARKTTIELDLQTVSPPNFYFPLACNSEILSASRSASLKLTLARLDLEHLQRLDYSDRLPVEISNSNDAIDEARELVSDEVRGEIQLTEQKIGNQKGRK